MPDPSWNISHRQLMSVMIALSWGGDQATPTYFKDLGYQLNEIELRMADSFGRGYQVDLQLFNADINLSVLCDCKTFGGNIDRSQVERYFATTGAEVVVRGGLNLRDPRGHRADSLFVVLPSVVDEMAQVAATCTVRSINGWGILEVDEHRIALAHDEVSDPRLSNALTDGWIIDLTRTAPLERLPYEPDCPDWELADVIFQTLLSFWLQRKAEFGLDELCQESNELWPFLGDNQHLIANRIRDEIRTIRRTALKNWLARVNVGTAREERWRFTRRASAGNAGRAAFQRRAEKYVTVLRVEDRRPRADEFVRIDPEQLELPL